MLKDCIYSHSEEVNEEAEDQESDHAMMWCLEYSHFIQTRFSNNSLRSVVNLALLSKLFNRAAFSNFTTKYNK